MDPSHNPPARRKRLIRAPGNDGLSIEAMEGLGGWKAGLTVVRLGRTRSVRRYTYIVFDERDSIVAVVSDRYADSAWDRILDALRAKGYAVNEATGAD